MSNPDILVEFASHALDDILWNLQTQHAHVQAYRKGFMAYLDFLDSVYFKNVIHDQKQLYQKKIHDMLEYFLRETVPHFSRATQYSVISANTLIFIGSGHSPDESELSIDLYDVTRPEHNKRLHIGRHLVPSPLLKNCAIAKYRGYPIRVRIGNPKGNTIEFMVSTDVPDELSSFSFTLTVSNQILSVLKSPIELIQNIPHMREEEEEWDYNDVMSPVEFQTDAYTHQHHPIGY